MNDMVDLAKSNDSFNPPLMVRLISVEPRLLLLGIVFMALAIRAVYATVAVEVDPVLRQNALHGDAYGYHLLASHLAHGNGFSWDGENLTSYRMPGYPAFLAAIYAGFGQNFLVVRLVQALLGSLLCLPIFALARQALGDRLALLAALGVAVHPMLMYMTGWIYAETVYMSLLWLGLWLLGWSISRLSLRAAVPAHCRSS
jgi:4-amino-4-deoxy-L-arabinose transferase-like glycosyltransferase